MAEIDLVARQVVVHWVSQGLRVSSVGPQEIAALAGSCRERIPADYEAFLRIAGVPADEDNSGFRFWSPAEVRLTDVVLRQAGYAIDTLDVSMIFADYMQESWWYALWLAGPFAGSVSVVVGNATGRDPQPPLGTFVEFLGAYIRDDRCLYPPK